MNLLVISHTPHYRRRDGRIVGWGPTVLELDHLSTRFDRVRHIACLHPGEPAESYLPYGDARVELVPVPPTGGDRWVDKLGVLRATPRYLAVILRELVDADMVHIRCPANVPMLGAALLPFVRRPRARWIKYAGQWKPAQRDSVAFAFQRWFLAKPWHRGVVTVNGRWPGQPDHVKSFFNPSLGDAELARARQLATDKTLGSPLRLLFVGTFAPKKGLVEAIETLDGIVAANVDATLDIVGDGPERSVHVARVANTRLDGRVRFHGWLPRHELADHYARAHVILLPSRSEGWPKVLSEGMAYGVVPVAGRAGAIQQYLEEFGVGRAVDPERIDLLVSAVLEYARAPELWRRESQRAVASATAFSFAHYLRAVDELMCVMDFDQPQRGQTRRAWNI